jgi:hypothetical protein
VARPKEGEVAIEEVGGHRAGRGHALDATTTAPCAPCRP